jgi:hypothetical protein
MNALSALILFSSLNNTLFRYISKSKGMLSSPALQRLGFPKVGIHVHFAVGIWTEYTGSSVVEVCELRSYEALELYWQYVRRLDNLVDNSVGMGMFNQHRKALKREDIISSVIFEFVHWLRNSQLPRSRKRHLVSLFGDYRREVSFGVLADTVMHQMNGIQPSTELIPRVEQISGRTATNLMRILNIIHNVTPAVAVRLENIFFQWSMAFQIVDDLIDSISDWKENVYNLIIAFLYENEDEKQRFIEDAQRNQIRSPNWWIRNAPETHAAIQALFDEYISNLLAIDPKSKVTQDLQKMTCVGLQIASYPWIQILQSRAHKSFAKTVDGFPTDVAPNQDKNGQDAI